MAPGKRASGCLYSDGGVLNCRVALPFPMRRAALFALLIFVVSAAQGQEAERVGVQTVTAVGARAAARAGAGVADDAAGWASLNPAVLAALSAPRLQLYGDQGFGLAELRTGALQLAYPWGRTGVAVGAQTLGFDAFRTSNLTLGAGRAFALGTQRSVQVGLAAVLHHAQIAGYGSGTGVALDAGVQVEVGPGLWMGAAGRNLAAARLAGLEPLPQTFAAGLCYRPDARVAVVADVVKDTRFPLSARGGLEIRPATPLALRVGAATAPTVFSAGVGLRLGTLAADLAATRHDVLGWTPAVELGVSW